MNIQINIKRIQDMEIYLDEMLKISDISLLYNDEDLKTKVKLLIDYLESGKWLEDYQLDEQNQFPLDLKRGVLSQDTLYNFLENIDVSKL